MNPVQSLQHMLNQIALTIHTMPRLVENGRFDEATLEAVMIFQRDFYPPVTGVVDHETWDAILELYLQEQFLHGHPSPLRVLPNGTTAYPEAYRAPQILVAQAMLAALNEWVSNFQPSNLDGMNTGATLYNFSQVQSLAGLPATGTLDRSTWSALTRLFEAVVTRGAFHEMSARPPL